MKTIVLATMCATLVGVGVVGGFFFAFNTMQSNPSSTLPEYLLLSDPEYGDSGSWFAVTINNTGVGAVTIVKVLVNYIKQQAVNPVLPYTVAPDHGFMLNVTIDLSQNRTYQIDLYTSQGNKFSKFSQVPTGGHQVGVVLYKANTGFYNHTGTLKIIVDVGNSGTLDTTLTDFFIGTSTTNMQNMSITPVPLPAGRVGRITVAYNWTKGGTHFFKVQSSTGQTIDWPETAPIS